MTSGTSTPGGDSDRIWQRNVTVVQIIPVWLTLMFSLVAVGVSFSNRAAVMELRVATLEHRDEQYDSLIQRRNDQLADINRALTTLVAQREGDRETLAEIRSEQQRLAARLRP